MKQEEFVSKGNKIHNNKFDYSKAKYDKGNIKVCIICPIHGEFWQVPYAHLAGRGCNMCRGMASGDRMRKSKQDFIIDSIAIHGDKYEYDKFEYKNNKTKSIITCKIHGDFIQSPSEHLAGNGCTPCGKISSLQKKNCKFVTKHPLYNTWIQVRGRCRDPKNQSYNRYGALGVCVSDEFYDSFDVFKDYLMSLPDYEKKFTHGWTLDRINTKGNYERGNLRWATKKVQRDNQRARGRYGYDGVDLDKFGRWNFTIVIKKTGFNSLEEALEERNNYINNHNLPNKIQIFSS